MKQLETQVQSKGFTFEIIERTEFTAIQRQICRDSGKLVAFEVFRINKNQEFTLGGNVIPASESRPSNEQFGATAFCYSLSGSTEAAALAKAKAKYAELEAKAIEKLNQANAA